MTISAIEKTVIGSIDDIPLGEGRTFTVEDEMIAVFRLRDGSLRAVSAVCPHKGGPLADGQIDNRVVVCPLHLFSWDLATGCSQSGQPPITVYPVRVDGDLIVLGE
ncbi:putative nitrite reductase small subunit [Actinoplanes missouriensis 431]|uniref:Putative nitrite reductase small subunit n=1 Tax=Actinoplanes missouriensis (strain ATCC 14538 / DSM 43046 / CBS 188.64 / JCM 3121 / NBRC 102363 / NCIMB 12654 / NRRL B-3342 / UNCC 431) TaxID=512565 RepID=I0H7T4_ACTM4|nr:Rieske 2Fe-2S domain-containing protein [Actinoplanes missouriensis]BAL89071.1 putative nitrite reductase small subunit [Actinoplanes missouriensis 431]